MNQIPGILYILLFFINLSFSQDKVPIVTFGLERGIERSNNDVFFVDDIGNTVIRNETIHNYWRLYVGIPIRFPKFKIDVGLGFSSNRFQRSLAVNGGFPGHNYSGIGFEYFLKIPLGIGEKRFDMGTEFRHQILMFNSSRSTSGFISPNLGDGTVNNSYFSLGAYANYMIVMTDKVDMGLTSSLGLSAFKYKDTFFLSNDNNLSFYLNFGIVFYMYKSPKE